jgi:MFS family permease
MNPRKRVVARARARGISKFFRDLDRRIKILFLFIGVHQFDQQLTLQYNSLYAVGLGASPVELGTLTSIRSVISSLFALPGGWLVDKYGSKKIVLLGLTFMTAVAAIYSVASDWIVILPAFLLYGIGSQLILPYARVVHERLEDFKNSNQFFQKAHRSFSSLIAS